jgi:negative regulator of flagellin synthesis FlgM
MSYTNGVGNLQQVLNTVAPATTQPASQATESANGPKRQSVSQATPGHSDQASLSSAGGMLAHALAGSDTRPDRIAALQQAIAAGTYKVSSSDVAGKMIQSLLE